MSTSFNKSIDMEEINDLLESCGPDTKLYVGCDSRVIHKFGVRMAKYTTVIVIHFDGKHGGRIFAEHSLERDFSVSRKKPSPRLMTEVYKVSEMYLRLLNEVENCLAFDIEVHLDINPKKENKSAAIINEAIGYVQGVCQVTPKVKPEAWCSSTVADAW